MGNKKVEKLDKTLSVLSVVLFMGGLMFFTFGMMIVIFQPDTSDLTDGITKGELYACFLMAVGAMILLGIPPSKKMRD